MHSGIKLWAEIFRSIYYLFNRKAARKRREKEWDKKYGR